MTVGFGYLERSKIMEPEKIRTLAILLGVDPMKLSIALDELDRGEQSNFYYDSNVFRKLHSIDYEGLRKLVIPDIRRLRR